MPSDKRARQRAAREARLAAEAKSKKRRTQLRNGGIVVLVAAVVIVIVVLTQGSTPPKKSSLTVKTTTTTTTKPGATTTTAAGATTTTTVATAASNAKAQKAANLVATKAGCPASITAAVNTQKYTSAPAMTIDPNKLYSATIKTTLGTVQMSLFAKAAPITVNNFVFLADKGWFNCNTFFRVIPGFVDQTGSNKPPNGEPAYKFANENVPTAYQPGDVAMANGGPDTNSSEFFFLVPGGQTQLNADLSSGGYSLFGQVTSGLDIVEQINAQGTSGGTPAVTQRILSVTINESAGL